MFINDTWCELDAFDEYKGEADYHIVKYKGIKDFLKNNPESKRTEAYEIPVNFTQAQCNKGIKWWRIRQNRKDNYGIARLFSFIWSIPMRGFMHRYYLKHKKPYPILAGIKNDDVCSVAVDKALRYMNYDMFPEFDEHVTYPGLYAEKLKGYKVVIR